MSVPSANSPRIEIIDVLRGFALFGIVIIHMIEQYFAGEPPAQFVQNPPLQDGIVQGLAFLLIMGKFFMIFSFLFGLSFFIQFSKSEQDRNFLIRFAWRLIILLAIGIVHHLHYRGDILTIYAMLGFSLLLFYRLPDKYLLILACILILNVPAFLTRTVQIFYPPADNAQDPAVALAYYETVKHGSYLDIITANFNSFSTKMGFQIWSGRIYITLGLFLLGIYAGRKRFFEKLAEHLQLIRKFRRWALWTLLGCVVFGVVFFGGAIVLSIKLSNQVNWAIGGVIFDVFNAALFIIYMAGIMLLFQREKWKNRLMLLFPVGKMGLTVYLMQTFFGTLIFFSYGLALIYELGAMYSMLLAIAIFLVQMIFAHLWFRRFAYGPVEWLWRNLTFFRIQKITLSKQAAST